MNLPRPSLAVVLLGLAFSSVQATTIYLNSGNGTGNTTALVFTNGTHTVTATAESLISPATNWVNSSLGQYSGGLGVTNSTENGSSPGHTVDNNASGAIDRVVFSFNTSVILESVYLSAYGDTDITVYYWASAAWVTLENNTTSSTSNRTANINNGSPPVDATKWAIGAKSGNDNDYFKIKSISFTEGPPRTQVPDLGSTLLMMTGSFGGLMLISRFFSKGKAVSAVA